MWRLFLFYSLPFFTEAEPRPTGHAAGWLSFGTRCARAVVGEGAVGIVWAGAEPPVFLSSLGADEGCHVVELVALVAGDGGSAGVVGPWGDEEHLPAGTGIEHLSTGFPQRGEAVLEQLDDGDTCRLNNVHDSFLARADAG